MLVETKDGTCRECGGQLKIVDVDDATMTVECLECGDNYPVEPDAFGDGCMTYYAEVALRGESDEDEEDW